MLCRRWLIFLGFIQCQKVLGRCIFTGGVADPMGRSVINWFFFVVKSDWGRGHLRADPSSATGMPPRCPHTRLKLKNGRPPPLERGRVHGQKSMGTRPRQRGPKETYFGQMFTRELAGGGANVVLAPCGLIRLQTRIVPFWG